MQQFLNSVANGLGGSLASHAAAHSAGAAAAASSKPPSDNPYPANGGWLDATHHKAWEDGYAGLEWAQVAHKYGRASNKAASTASGDK